VEFDPSAPHDVHFFDPDSSYLPAINSFDPATLQLSITGRARIAGDLNGYGLDLTGDTLVVDSTVTGGPAGASAALRMLRTGQIYGGTSWSTFAIGTTQFTAPGQLLSLPYDTLIVSDTLQGSFSQVVSANRLIVTGPGSPLHAGPHPGWLYLQGGDGNTTVNVNGDAFVSGAGAAIFNNFGTLAATGDLLVDKGGLLVSTVTGCCGQSLFDVGGNVTMDGGFERDSLVSGLLRVGGNFTQLGTTVGASFTPDSTFQTVFTGARPHIVAFQTPSDRTGNGSFFGGLTVGDSAGAQEIDFQGDYWIEGVLATSSSNGVTFHNTGAALSRIRAQDVAVQSITFDHVQFQLEKHSDPAAGTGTIDGLTFANFQNDEDQFIVILPGLSTQYNWSNVNFSPLGGGPIADAGRYVVATDWDGPTGLNTLSISIQTNNATSFELANYYQALNTAIISPFAP
jgi:hypothetical protein